MDTAHPGLIAGVVRDEDGAPVQDARVYFTDAPAPTPDVATLTAADGSFSLAAPVGGLYGLECRADGFAPSRASTVVRAGATVELTLRRA